MPCFENCYHYYQSENGKFCDIWGDYGPPCSHFLSEKCEYFETKEDYFLIPCEEYAEIGKEGVIYKYCVYDNGLTTPPTLVCYFKPKRGDSNAQ